MTLDGAESPTTATVGPRSRVADGVVAAMPRDYGSRKADQWCLYSVACPRRADGWPDSVHHYCTAHRTKALARKAKATKKRRRELREAGKCRRCKKPSSTYRCPACAILDQTKFSRSRVADGVVAAPASDPYRRDGNGWKRYRGKGRRGAPLASVDDDQDLKRAIAHVTRGAEAMAYARSAEVAKLGRIQQAGAMRAALSELALAARFIDSVVERREPKDG